MMEETLYKLVERYSKEQMGRLGLYGGRMCKGFFVFVKKWLRIKIVGLTLRF
jgi:hypothetical protein